MPIKKVLLNGAIKSLEFCDWLFNVAMKNPVTFIVFTLASVALTVAAFYGIGCLIYWLVRASGWVILAPIVALALLCADRHYNQPNRE